MKDNYREILEEIKSNVRDGKYRFTIHALERRIERDISKNEVEDSILNGEIIEEYPQDKYLPSCLILGYTRAKRPLHIQITCNPVWVITCYDPSEKPGEWSSDFKRRRAIK
ncbi:hypothetical protein S225a_03100 [Candidatus Brocadiaceae bacterium S225]|uniref:DUF4258 domain-containing protein n=1 Tax=Candidatus Scalindua brodae TaxID=237368 RepID=A0A0B0EJY3_9BACT|nr:MAG: hypothetical protein SCABRO_01893 [Candidatus Scalindua brodae]TWU36820.1 hypothetical protein S225a_03100 [Candidatus Brocadiaceae bacterium S225]